MFSYNYANERTYEFDGSGLDDASALDQTIFNANDKLTINIHRLEKYNGNSVEITGCNVTNVRCFTLVQHTTPVTAQTATTERCVDGDGTSLEYIDIEFNESNLENLFHNCSMKGVTFYPLDDTKATSTMDMFHGATSFNQQLELDTSNVIRMDRMFKGATSFNQPLGCHK